MLLVSIQVGIPQTHNPEHKPWESGIFKYPAAGRVWLDKLNLAGDGQQDLENHGGLFRAVLMYAASHYPVWRDELNQPDLPYGAFGENFTVSELTEATVYLGDIYQIGEIRVQVTQPRQPCWKLARRWDIKDLAARVKEKGWGGWYLRVLQEGFVEANTPVQLIERPYPQFSIARVNALINKREFDADANAQLAEIEALTPEWRQHFAKFNTEHQTS